MKTIFAAASILLFASLAHGFLPAPPALTATPSSANSAAMAHDASPTALTAVLNGGDPVNGDKPKLKLPNTCDSDYDCDGSEFCCEFMFFKMCCSDGWRAENDWVPVPVPVPVPIDPYYGRGGYR